MKYRIQALLLTGLGYACIAYAAVARADLDPATKQLSHDIYKQLIEINTTESSGSVTQAAEAMAQRLRDAGFAPSDIQILGPVERKKNLVVRLHGTGKRKPILMIGHLDVVEARREDWGSDPFKLVEKDGYFYGRGTQDMKDGDAVMMTTMIRLKKEGYKGDRDLILALTADEEGGSSNGVEWLFKNHRELVDAEYALNHDGQSVVIEKGKPVRFAISASEKLYADYQLTVTNPGGHSSLPSADNAIYRLVAGLERLAHYRFPFELNSVTRAYFERADRVESPSRAADMRAVLANPPDAAALKRLNADVITSALTHTTCVATRLDAGHANNALPQAARAIVNCRILPGHSAEEVRQTLIRVVADSHIVVRYISDAGVVMDDAKSKHEIVLPPLRDDVVKVVEKVVDSMWPGIPVIPVMSIGASDGVFVGSAGLPVYLISGCALDRDDNSAHGKNERLGIDSFYRGVEFHYRFISELVK